MTLLLICIAWFLVVAALLVHAVRQYRYYTVLRPIAAPAPEDAPAVSIIVPARNEEQNIARCLGGLLAQDYPDEKLQIVVVDDGSEDRTSAIAQDLAQRDARIKLLRNDSLPPGWLGKPHACWRGVQESEGDWICFIDADTVAQPPLIRTAVHTARERSVHLLSLEPFQELGSLWERLLLPAGFFLIAFTQDLRKTNDPHVAEASVNGQFLLVRRDAYETAGGHAAVRSAVAEDSALARNLKAAGCRVALAGTDGLLHVRMYTSRPALIEGAARQLSSLLPGFRLPLFGSMAVVLVLVCLMLPLWAAMSVAIHGGAIAIASLALASAGSLAMVGTHVGASRYFRIPFWYGLLFPAGYALGAWVVVFAMWERSRRQMRWKGRVYQAAAHV
jgi:chlorobactene glucosyltransferase